MHLIISKSLLIFIRFSNSTPYTDIVNINLFIKNIPALELLSTVNVVLEVAAGQYHCCRCTYYVFGKQIVSWHKYSQTRIFIVSWGHFSDVVFMFNAVQRYPFHTIYDTMYVRIHIEWFYGNMLDIVHSSIFLVLYSHRQICCAHIISTYGHGVLGTIY